MKPLYEGKDFYGITKPSEALRAMVDGLLEYSQSPNFRIAMGTYGEAEEEGHDYLCFGCAATCAAMKLAGSWPEYFSVNTLIRRKASPFGEKVQAQFEAAINDFRETGDLALLGEFFGFDAIEMPLGGEHGWRALRDSSWRECLPAVEAVIIKLQTLGF